MKATGIVRRIDDLGRVVIPKEIRRVMRIREGAPYFTTLTQFDRFCVAIHSISKRIKAELNSLRLFQYSRKL
jgi:bifunctional DNA-binding transcriptional regulator/antitoxin component of YhaV-PrlF toxin-antitoxin module